jgi:hypothetical protein
MRVGLPTAPILKSLKLSKFLFSQVFKYKAKAELLISCEANADWVALVEPTVSFLKRWSVRDLLSKNEYKSTDVWGYFPLCSETECWLNELALSFGRDKGGLAFLLSQLFTLPVIQHLASLMNWDFTLKWSLDLCLGTTWNLILTIDTNADALSN